MRTLFGILVIKHGKRIRSVKVCAVKGAGSTLRDG